MSKKNKRYQDLLHGCTTCAVAPTLVPREASHAALPPSYNLYFILNMGFVGEVPRDGELVREQGRHTQEARPQPIAILLHVVFTVPRLQNSGVPSTRGSPGTPNASPREAYHF